MTQLFFSLVTQDGSKHEAVSYEIPDDEWGRLKRFHIEVENLRATNFVQKKQGGQIAMKWQAGAMLRSNANPVDTEAVWAMLLRLRPFVLKNEDYYFHKIKNLLSRRLEHHVFRKHLGLLSEIFALKTLQEKVDLNFSGRKMLSVETVMDWLNAFAYHRDQDKKQLVESDLGFLGDDEDGLPVVLFALVDMIKAVLGVGSLVETLMQVESNSLDKISYPLEWASGT